MRRPWQERILDKFEVTDGCWNWSAKIDHYGYGRLARSPWEPPRTVRAHRLVYELVVGPVAGGLVLDHTCLNKRCVNPDHLEPVTRAENSRRARLASPNPPWPTCKNGHEWTDQNTYWTPDGKTRRCRTCVRAYRREWSRAKGK